MKLARNLIFSVLKYFHIGFLLGFAITNLAVQFQWDQMVYSNQFKLLLNYLFVMLPIFIYIYRECLNVLFWQPSNVMLFDCGDNVGAVLQYDALQSVGASRPG